METLNSNSSNNLGKSDSQTYDWQWAQALFPWQRILAGGVSRFKEIRMVGDIYDKNGNLITAGGSTDPNAVHQNGDNVSIITISPTSCINVPSIVLSDNTILLSGSNTGILDNLFITGNPNYPLFGYQNNQAVTNIISSFPNGTFPTSYILPVGALKTVFATKTNFMGLMNTAKATQQSISLNNPPNSGEVTFLSSGTPTVDVMTADKVLISKVTRQNVPNTALSLSVAILPWRAIVRKQLEEGDISDSYFVFESGNSVISHATYYEMSIQPLIISVGSVFAPTMNIVLEDYQGQNLSQNVDVGMTFPANNELLMYDNSIKKWKNAPLSSLGNFIKNDYTNPSLAFGSTTAGNTVMMKSDGEMDVRSINGSINLITEDNYSGNGRINLYTGSADGTHNVGSGSINLIVGDCSNGAYAAGGITLQAGNIVNGVSPIGQLGDISLSCGTIIGTTGNYNGGNVYIDCSSGLGTGNDGKILLRNRDTNQGLEIKKQVMTTTVPNYETYVLANNDIPNKKYVDDALTSRIPTLIQDLANVDSAADPGNDAKFLRWNDTINQWVDDYSRLRSDTISNITAISGTATGSTFMDSVSKDIILKDNSNWYNVPAVPLTPSYNSFNTIYNPTLRWIPESISGTTGALVWPSIVGSGSIGFQGANSNFQSNAIGGRPAININPAIASDQTRYVMLDLGAVYNGTNSFTVAVVVQDFNVLSGYSDSCYISLLDSTPFVAGNWDIPTAVLAVNIQGNSGNLRSESNGSTTTWTNTTQYSYVGATPTLVVIKYNHAITEWSIQINNVNDSIRTTNTRNFGALAIRYLTFGWVNQYAGTNACQMKISEASFWNSALSAGTITSMSADILGAYGVRTQTYSAGALTVSKGGTGATSFTTNTFLQGNGTNAITAIKVVPTGAVVGTTDIQTLTNKSLQDSTTTFTDDAVPSKAFRFENSSITTGQTRILTVPDSSGTIVLNTTLGTTGFLQNGNAFGTTAVLGTTDNNDIRMIRNNLELLNFYQYGIYGRSQNGNNLNPLTIQPGDVGGTDNIGNNMTIRAGHSTGGGFGTYGGTLYLKSGDGSIGPGSLYIQAGASLAYGGYQSGGGVGGIYISTPNTTGSYDTVGSGSINLNTGGGGLTSGKIVLKTGDGPSSALGVNSGNIEIGTGNTSGSTGGSVGSILLTCGVANSALSTAKSGGNITLQSSVGSFGGTNGVINLYSSPTSGVRINSVTGNRVLAMDCSSISASTTRTQTVPDRTGYQVVANVDMPITLTTPAIGQRLEYTGSAWVNTSPEYAVLSFVNYTTPTSIATTTLNAYVLVNPVATLTVNTGNFSTPSNGRIQFNGTGTYDIEIVCDIVGNFVTNARAGAFRIYKDGVAITDSEMRTSFDNASFYNSTIINFISTATNGSYFEVYMANVANNSAFDLTKLRIQAKLLKRTA